MSAIGRITLALVIIGAINWGLIGFFKFDLVATLFGGQTSFLSRVVYALVGLSGIACLSLLFKPSEEIEPSRTYQRYNEANLNTEFGEEPDFDEIQNKEIVRTKSLPSTKYKK
ncbi:DUF378 domain-containing protein [Sporosarcina sp. CAU 1771]